jgi:DME family drug/metabolite transporter
MTQDLASSFLTIIQSRSPSKVAPLLGIGLVVLGAALWATVGIAVGLMQLPETLGSETLGLSRTVLGATALMAVSALRGQFLTTSRIDWKALLCFGLANALFQICLFRAFAEVGVTITVAVTVCLPPLIVTVGIGILARRLPSLPVMVALVAATLGVFLIVRPTWSSEVQQHVTPYGVTLLLLAATAFSVVAVSARHICKTCDPICGTGLGLAICALGLACFGIFSGTVSVGQLTEMRGVDLAILLYIGLGATAGAYLAFNIGLKLCPSSASGLVAGMIEPALAAILAVLLLGERLETFTLLGCAVVAGAMLMLSMDQLRLARRSP